MRGTIAGAIMRISSHFAARSPVVWSVRQHKDCVAVTFDDGPTELTPHVLESLAQGGAKATFFVLGSQVVQRPEVVRQILARGHEIGIHGYDHSMRGFYDQVLRCGRELAPYGVVPHIVRTPGGAIPLALTLRLWSSNYTNVLWSLDAHDSMRLEGKWPGPAPDYSQVKGGDIVLMHDDNTLCVQDLPILLEFITKKHLHPVTVSELLGR